MLPAIDRRTQRHQKTPYSQGRGVGGSQGPPIRPPVDCRVLATVKKTQDSHGGEDARELGVVHHRQRLPFDPGNVLRPEQGPFHAHPVLKP